MSKIEFGRNKYYKVESGLTGYFPHDTDAAYDTRAKMIMWNNNHKWQSAIYYYTKLIKFTLIINQKI